MSIDRFAIHESLPSRQEPRFAPGVAVKKRVFRIPEFLLECGTKLQDVAFGYETYGNLNESGDNAILIAHHFSGTSHAAGRYAESDPEPGYWDSVIGPGKAIDTDRFFVVSADTLCNLNTKNPLVVTTGPASLDPNTGQAYAKNFPIVTISDFVRAQKVLCDALGITRFHAVAGPSMGSLQAMEWAARYPQIVDRVISAIPAGLATEPYLIAMLNVWMSPILLDPNFKGGDYTEEAEPIAGLTEALKLVTFTALHHGWAKRLFARRWTNPEKNPLHHFENVFAIESALQRTAADRAKIADANSLLRLARAVQLFSIEERKTDLCAKFLVIPAISDLLMFPEYAQRGVDQLKAMGLHVETFEIEGDGGHLDGLNLISQAATAIRTFLDT